MQSSLILVTILLVGPNLIASQKGGDSYRLLGGSRQRNSPSRVLQQTKAAPLPPPPQQQVQQVGFGNEQVVQR